jgi:hypothetical protein
MDTVQSIVACGQLEVVVWLHTKRDPTAAEWRQGVSEIARVKERLKGDLSRMRCIAVTDGGAPNATQRGELFTDVLGDQVKIAAVSVALSNPLKRGITTAISWLNPLFRAYPPEKFDLALGHLNLNEHRATIIAELRHMQLKLETNETLRLLGTSPPSRR